MLIPHLPSLESQQKATEFHIYVIIVAFSMNSTTNHMLQRSYLIQDFLESFSNFYDYVLRNLVAIYIEKHITGKTKCKYIILIIIIRNAEAMDVLQILMWPNLTYLSL